VAPPVQEFSSTSELGEAGRQAVGRAVSDRGADFGFKLIGAPHAYATISAEFSVSATPVPSRQSGDTSAPKHRLARPIAAYQIEGAIDSQFAMRESVHQKTKEVHSCH
jgi:hypothetical protein